MTSNPVRKSVPLEGFRCVGRLARLLFAWLANMMHLWDLWDLQVLLLPLKCCDTEMALQKVIYGAALGS